MRFGGGRLKSLIPSGFQPIGKFRKLFNPAFTLAEVLITLGIIGVIAAMTIPTLMAKINERQSVTKLKKVYSTLSNAMRILEHDEDIDWISCVQIYDDYDDARIKCEQKLATTMKATYEQSHGSIPIDLGFRSNVGFDSIIQAMDGATYYILGCGIFYGGIFVDINGNEGPNKNGIDIFGFYYDNSKTGSWDWDPNIPVTLKPYGYTYNEGTSGSKCNKNNIGIQCTAQVLETGKMDYLK